MLASVVCVLVSITEGNHEFSVPYVQFQPICTEMRSVHLLRHNHNCSLDTSTTVTKLGRHIDVIMVRPVIPHSA